MLDGSCVSIQNSQGKDTYGWSDINYSIDWFADKKNTINFYGYLSPKSGLIFNADETKEWFTGGSTIKYLTNSP